MSRTFDLDRPTELLNATLGYVIANGLADLSLRPLAKAIGSSPRVLLYYFGSKEKLVQTIFNEIRANQFQSLKAIEAQTFVDACRLAWAEMKRPKSVAWFKLFFEAYAQAAQRPKLYSAFLRGSAADWESFLSQALAAEGVSPDNIQILVIYIMAGFRGFMLEYCGGIAVRQVDAAFGLWVTALGPMLSSKGR